MTLQGIIDYANTVDLSEVEEVLERQVRFNTAISQEGLDNPWGARVGKTMLENWSDDVKCNACARAAAGSDARMSGCPLPVIINSGSGNQGITVTMPVVTYAERMHLSTAKMYRCLLVSNLVSIYIKHYIGSLSAFCGAVSAACGAGAATLSAARSVPPAEPARRSHIWPAAAMSRSAELSPIRSEMSAESSATALSPAVQPK